MSSKDVVCLRTLYCLDWECSRKRGTETGGGDERGRGLSNRKRRDEGEGVTVCSCDSVRERERVVCERVLPSRA